MTRFYLILTIVGVLAPYGAFVPWLVNHGLDLPLLLTEASANPISLFAWLDVVIAALALLGFIIADGQKNHVKGRGIAIVGTLVVGVSCGLPLYLYLKEKQNVRSSIMMSQSES
ncbi:DUF2834 domain-containing protein [Vibrio mangrovi]|nr:DUF2834 domain-containing protein [Vibrio mangrovi]MDW6005005.1 DUF2834 domain-containing protein [Vibrio mangrovi]